MTPPSMTHHCTAWAARRRVLPGMDPPKAALHCSSINTATIRFAYPVRVQLKSGPLEAVGRGVGERDYEASRLGERCGLSSTVMDGEI